MAGERCSNLFRQCINSGEDEERERERESGSKTITRHGLTSGRGKGRCGLPILERMHVRGM